MNIQVHIWLLVICSFDMHLFIIWLLKTKVFELNLRVLVVYCIDNPE